MGTTKRFKKGQRCYTPEGLAVEYVGPAPGGCPSPPPTSRAECADGVRGGDVGERKQRWREGEMSTELIDLRTLPEGTLCEATGPLRTILGPVATLLGLPDQGVRFRVVTPDDGTEDYPCGVRFSDEIPAQAWLEAWLEAMQPAKVVASPPASLKPAQEG